MEFDTGTLLSIYVTSLLISLFILYEIIRSAVKAANKELIQYQKAQFKMLTVIAEKLNADKNIIEEVVEEAGLADDPHFK